MVSSNLIISDHNTLENIVQRIWKVGSYDKVAKKYPSLLPLNEIRALDILESTSTKLNGQYKLRFFGKNINHTYQATKILPFQE